ncbi:hypothetical protein BCR32DRAFT_324997 [Anaeromyces robustus]|uniref:Uncharacterized protein n=1 Tax=Anaeromyces robustus TaxID=1754192 RepID=A0A1Y1XKP8_9FUNG|nr:hypothetical protein BCR32DRAFT_324997 [Anaeromyces robustus]|eukprot:ORX86331.1 hypothetical protein BCR32DRAFT_324997 [Anaeromyces robustus]
MKFSNSFLTLLAATCVYSAELKKDFGLKSKYVGLDINTSGSNLTKRGELAAFVSPECQKDLNESPEYACLASDFKPADYKEKCPVILSDVCDKFFADPTKYFPNCKNDAIIQTFTTSKATMEYLKYNVHFTCSTDESGKMCSAAEVSINGGFWNEEDILNNCASKKCTDALNDMLTVLLENMEELKKDGTFQSYGNVEAGFSTVQTMLQSDTCTKKSGSSSGSNTSDANTLTKISSYILTTLSLVLPFI